MQLNCWCIFIWFHVNTEQFMTRNKSGMTCYLPYEIKMLLFEMQSEITWNPMGVQYNNVCMDSLIELKQWQS